jgi:hypothetical protein
MVDNFDIFQESMDAPSYEQWIRSYLHKLGVMLEFLVFRTDQGT